MQLIKEVPVEVVRESQQPLPNTHVDSFETKTYLMSERERAAREREQPPPTSSGGVPTDAVLRRKGGWSGAPPASTVSGEQTRPRPMSAASAASAQSRRAAAPPSKPEQYASTKSGFVSGRNVWTGTSERRAQAAIAAAKAATSIS